MSSVAHPYQPVVDALNSLGIKATISQSPKNLAAKLLRANGQSVPDLNKRQAAWILRRFAEIKEIDLPEPSLGRKQVKAEYKPLNWPTRKEQSDYMRMRKEENTSRSLANPNENWMATLIVSLGIRGHWKRQYTWGYRICDFFEDTLGVAIEVDGPEHDPAYDGYRDIHNFLRSGIVVLRVRNRNLEDAKLVARFVEKCDGRRQRRHKIAPNATEHMALVNQWRLGDFDAGRLLVDTRNLGTVPVGLSSYFRSRSQDASALAPNHSFQRTASGGR